MITDGNEVRGFKQLACLEVKHFLVIFKDPDRTNIGEILKVVANYLRMVGIEENEILFEVITKEELLKILNTFQKDKSVDPDGWLVEFYLDFFEQVGEDLLNAV